MISFDDDRPFQSIALFKDAKGPGEAEAFKDYVIAAHDGTAPGSMWSLFDPEITFYVPPELPYGGTFRGIEAVKKAHGATRDYYDRIRIEIEEIACVGDLALMYFQFNFRARKNGRTGSFPMIEIFRFRDQKVIEWRGFHYDPAAVAEILTAEPSQA